MAYKIYKKGAFILLENTVTGDLKEINSQYVQIAKAKASLDKYEVLENGVSRLSIGLADIQDENGAAYSDSAWDIFRYQQCGSVNSSEVANPYPAPTITVVDITSAQILAMGTSPIELLPAPGVGKYYDVEKVVLEYTHVTTAYANIAGTDDFAFEYGGDSTMFPSWILAQTENSFGVISLTQGYQADVNTSYNTGQVLTLNTALRLKTSAATDPTLGDGTLRAIITYTVRTFGA